MSECKYEPCNNEAAGKSAFCGKSCRAQHSRRNNRSATVEPRRNIEGATSESATTVTIETDPVTKDDVCVTTTTQVEPASLADYHDPDGRHYATRTNPDTLNWGEPMSLPELEQAGLKANRVTIPGDWDYVGVRKEVT